MSNLYDVVIYEIASRRIAAVVGTKLPMSTGHYNAEKRLETVLGQIGENYDAEIVPTNRFQKGDVLPVGIEIEVRDKEAQ